MKSVFFSLLLTAVLTQEHHHAHHYDHHPSDQSSNGQYKVVTYFPEWAIYDQKFFVKDLPAKQLTHINYAFTKVSSSGEIQLSDPWAAVEMPMEGGVKGNLGALILLKQQNPGLKTLVSIGGWSDSDRFSDVALNDQTRQKFARSAVAFVNEHQMDGIDIDWEYPVGGGMDKNHHRPEDGGNYVLLLKELRAQLNALGQQKGKQYLLTVASPAGDDNFKTFKLGDMAKYLDWFNLMTYDYHGDWESQTNHQAALYANPQDPSSQKNRYFIDYTVSHYIAGGVPSQKIVLGTPLYCRGWKETRRHDVLGCFE
ncbi:hypothetical protein FGO68_gene688 [Halteria grandinella]|uniref:GH18 domain-containing protein n=1 Tax=Halteria grandinella TaxID=5974 RepID=A0A8J8T1T7_HALGN|nr:hypothetical protein FGO68_gene688 [Halteria grandinella]